MLSRASSFLTALAVCALASCAYIPRSIEGLPADGPWLALPLRSWVLEEGFRPEAMAICRPPECRPGLAVAVVSASGREAGEAEAVLRQPQRLARALTGKERKVDTLAAAIPLAEEGATGFFLTIGRRDGGKPPVYGAALGRRVGTALRLVLVVGESADAVEATVRSVARQHLAASAVVSQAARPYGDTAPRTASDIPEGPQP